MLVRIVHWGCWVELQVSCDLNVLLLGEHAIEAARVRELGALGVHVLDQCATLQSALALLTAIAPEVIVIDPIPWGACVISQLRSVTKAPVLVMSARLELEHVLACLEAGAAGYVTTQLDATHLVRALRDVIDGQTPLSANVSTLLRPLLRDRRMEQQHAVGLTDREHSVLSMLVNGHAYAAIADALGIGLGTVQSHVKNLYRKLDVCTKAEAATIAFRHGLLSTRPERRRARAIT